MSMQHRLMAPRHHNKPYLNPKSAFGPKLARLRRREVDDVFRDFSLTHQIGLKKSAPVEFGIRGGEKNPNLETFCPTGQPITMANGTMDCNVKLP